MDQFCLGCSKYAREDPVGRALALACVVPYLAPYHIAVAAYSRRDPWLALNLVGLLTNLAAGLALKRLFAQPRPSAMCEVLGTCGSSGFPSSHAQAVAYCMVVVGLAGWKRVRRAKRLRAREACVAAGTATGERATAQDGGPGTTPSGDPSKARARLPRLAVFLARFEVAAAGVLVALVGWGRVRLGYHTTAQVLSGIALGLTGGLVWNAALGRWHSLWSPPLRRLAAELL